VLAAREKLYPAGGWRVAQAQSLLGAALMAQTRYAEAEMWSVGVDPNNGDASVILSATSGR